MAGSQVSSPVVVYLPVLGPREVQDLVCWPIIDWLFLLFALAVGTCRGWRLLPRPVA